LKRLRFPTALLTFLFAAVLVFSPRSQAVTYNGEPVYYTVINDSLIELTYATMPIYRNGIIYIPYTVLSDNFEIRSTYSSSDQVLFLSNGDTMIKFDIRRQKTFDSNQKELRQPALTAKGQIFVPAQFTANYLGLGYIYLADANIVRLGDHRVSYPDAFLASYLQEEMNAALANLLNGVTGSSLPSSSATTTTAPVLPPRNLYLSFVSAAPENTQTLLELLNRYHITAAFFMDGARIEADPLSVAQLRVNGQVLGIYTDAAALPEDPDTSQSREDSDISIDSSVDPDQVLSTLESINSRYYTLLREKSRLLLLDGADAPELRGVGKSAGFLSCSPTHRFTMPEDAQSFIDTAAVTLSQSQGDVFLLLSDDAVTMQALPQLVGMLRQMDFVLSEMDAFGSGIAE